MSEKYVEIECLEEGELIFGTKTNGKWLVRLYDENHVEMGGSFHKTIEDACDAETAWVGYDRDGTPY